MVGGRKSDRSRMKSKKREYRVQFTGSREREWIPEDNVSEYLKRLYHSKYTLSGKKRKSFKTGRGVKNEIIRD